MYREPTDRKIPTIRSTRRWKNHIAHEIARSTSKVWWIPHHSTTGSPIAVFECTVDSWEASDIYEHERE